MIIIDRILDTKISHGSRELRYILHKDGSFDLIGRQISLKNCYPGTDGAPLRPIRVETVKNVINYTLAQGTIKVCFEKDDEGRIAISSRASGAERIHDYSPLAEGQIDDAAQIYVQGFGMEGPSGMFPIGGEQHTSHGLTALFKDSEAFLLYTEDHTRYSASFRIEQKNTLTHLWTPLMFSRRTTYSRKARSPQRMSRCIRPFRKVRNWQMKSKHTGQVRLRLSTEKHF